MGRSSVGEPNKAFKARSERMKSDDRELNAYVRYSIHNQNKPNNNAQFADISASGMRIVTRQPSAAQVGDQVEVEFTVPGTDESVVSSAQVVRKINEFVFAVRFLGVNEKNRNRLATAISLQFQSARIKKLMKPLAEMKALALTNRQGLTISAVAFLFFAILGSVIFLNTDEYKGVAPHTWTAPYPKQWDKDYVQHFNSEDDTATKSSRSRRR